MEFLVISASIFLFFIVVAILAPIGKAIDQKNKRLEKIIGKEDKIIDEELTKPLVERFIQPLIFSFLKALSKIFPKAKSKKNNNTQLAQDLKFAGLQISPSEFIAIKTIFTVSVIGLSILPLFGDKTEPLIKILILSIGFIASILGPRYFLKSKIKQRQENIREQLPDILDLLSVSVEAGLGFDSAILRVSMQTKGALTEELKTVYREMQLGRPKREALKQLSQRSTVEELRIFVSSVIQADQLGISIKNVLNNQSKQLRMTRKQRAQEKALKAPVKMTIPLVIFIFPVIFIILLGPSLMQIVGLVGS